MSTSHSLSDSHAGVNSGGSRFPSRETADDLMESPQHVGIELCPANGAPRRGKTCRMNTHAGEAKPSQSARRLAAITLYSVFTARGNPRSCPEIAHIQ